MWQVNNKQSTLHLN